MTELEMLEMKTAQAFTRIILNSYRRGDNLPPHADEFLSELFTLIETSGDITDE